MYFRLMAAMFDLPVSIYPDVGDYSYQSYRADVPPTCRVAVGIAGNYPRSAIRASGIPGMHVRHFYFRFGTVGF